MRPRRNRYYRGAKITTTRFRHVLRCFALDLTATETARVVRLSVRSVNDIYLKLRRRIARHCELQPPVRGVVEIDESYFGAYRVRGKCGRGAGGKTIVFGVFERDGAVQCQVVPDVKKRTLLRAIRGHVDLDSVIHSDGWPGYSGLVDVGYKKHLRVDHRHDEFARGRAHVNGLEAFWSYAKRRLAKFNGVHKRTFYLHLKETEFRYNHRRHTLYPVLLRMLRNEPI